MSTTSKERDDRGAAGIETPLAVIGLLALMCFVVGGLRVANTNGDVDAAARAGARAAATARSSGEASASASRVVGLILAERGIACSGGPSVSVSGAAVPGGAVTVNVNCTVSLADVALAGFPGSVSARGSAVELVDIIRGSG